MKISSTTTTRLVTSQEPVRKVALSAQKPLADVQPAAAKPMAVAAPQKFVTAQPATTSTAEALQNRAANDNRAVPRPTISAQKDPHTVYTSVAHFNLPS